MFRKLVFALVLASMVGTEVTLKLTGRSALLGFVIVLHSYDYISLFVSFVDIPVSLGSLF